MYETYWVNGREFIQHIKQLGRERGVTVRFESRHGKGSHGRLWYGDRFTTVKDRRRELGKGLRKAMLKQLGLNPDDLE